MKRTLVIAAALLLAACESMPSWMPGGGWTTLIDGEKGLENFERVGDANWRAEGGALVADKGKGGFLMSKSSYRDFQLRIENVTDKTCYEANIVDQRPDQTYATGGVVHHGKVLQPTKAGGKWNTYDITVKGSKMTVVLNGTRTAEIDNVGTPSGPIALQFGNLPKGPGGAIKWRKVQIKEL
jgi:hypothetical protein